MHPAVGVSWSHAAEDSHGHEDMNQYQWTLGIPSGVSFYTAQPSPCYYTHAFNGPFSRTNQVNWYQKEKTNLDFTEARESEWQCHQLNHMQVCTLLQTDNHASIPPLSFLQARCPSCHPTNSVEALKANPCYWYTEFTKFNILVTHLAEMRKQHQQQQFNLS